MGFGCGIKLTWYLDLNNVQDIKVGVDISATLRFVKLEKMASRGAGREKRRFINANNVEVLKKEVKTISHFGRKQWLKKLELIVNVIPLRHVDEMEKFSQGIGINKFRLSKTTQVEVMVAVCQIFNNRRVALNCEVED